MGGSSAAWLQGLQKAFHIGLYRLRPWFTEFFWKVGILHRAFLGVGTISGSFTDRYYQIGFSLPGPDPLYSSPTMDQVYPLPPSPLSNVYYAYCMPGTVLSSSLELTHLIFMTTLQGRYYYLHFTYEGNQDSEKVQERFPKFMLAQRLEPTQLSMILLPSGILYVAAKGWWAGGNI